MDILEKAKKLAKQVQTKKISIEKYEEQLIELAKQLDFTNSGITYEQYVNNYIKPEVEILKRNAKNNYLDKIYSSGCW